LIGSIKNPKKDEAGFYQQTERPSTAKSDDGEPAKYRVLFEVQSQADDECVSALVVGICAAKL
jgi:hypothetical protein